MSDTYGRFWKFSEAKLVEIGEKLEQVESKKASGQADRKGKKKTKGQRRADQSHAQMKKKLKQ